MKTIGLAIPDLILITPDIYRDSRGYFTECYNQRRFDEILPGIKFVQDNESKSVKGVLRGLHFQRRPHTQAKLVRVVKGSIWDVAVDLRVDSPTYKTFVGVELSEENHHQLFIPHGFAHGFVVTSDVAIVQYKTDTHYDADADGGIHAYDPELAISWPGEKKDHILSEKDQNLPLLADLEGTLF